MTNKTKFCKDCKHYTQAPVYARCAKVPDLVTGKPDGFCDIERKYGPCGSDAAMFEPKSSDGKPGWGHPIMLLAYAVVALSCWVIWKLL